MSARAHRRRLAAALLGLAVATWAIAGGVGVYRYVESYWLYRGFPAPHAPHGVPVGATRVVRFWSEALRQERAYLVHTPPGYATQAAEGRRFPVLYLLHAPPGRPDGFFLAGDMGVRADTLLDHHRIGPMLLVVPYGKSRRFRNDTEWANAGAGRYMDYVLDVVHDVDRRFATVPDRQGRAIAGLSEGGYGALNIALHHLDAFGAAQSWSGYFVQTPTFGFAGASRAALRANSPLDELAADAPAIRRLGFRAWVYEGLADDVPPASTIGFGRRLAAAGAAVDVGFFPGGHDWGLWRAQVPRMLLAAARWFATPARRARPGLVEVGARPAALAVRHAAILPKQCSARVRGSLTSCGLAPRPGARARRSVRSGAA